MTEKFEDVTVLGHPMLFTCLRVDRDTVPQGMYMYEVPACSSNHCGSATSGYALASWAIAFLEMPNAVAYTMYRPHNVMSSTPRSVKSLKSVR